jgi:hypothetical protein
VHHIIQLGLYTRDLASMWSVHINTNLQATLYESHGVATECRKTYFVGLNNDDRFISLDKFAHIWSVQRAVSR